MVPLLCAVACSWTPALADTIHLKNGNSVSGRLISLTRDLCIFETASAATLQISPLTVAGLSTSEPVTFTLNNGDRVVGMVLNLRSGMLFIHSDQFGYLSLDMQEVSAMSREADTASIPAPGDGGTSPAPPHLAPDNQEQRNHQAQQNGTAPTERFAQPQKEEQTQDRISLSSQAADAEQSKWREALRANTVEAYLSYLEAFPQGEHVPRVQLNLGKVYGDDYAEAARWYRKAAEQGLAEAQNNLGELYATGRGVVQNEAEAARWYHKAAEQGLAEAQNNLGELYATGRGVAQNEAEAVQWYRKAAEQNDPWGQYNLGRMYETGRSVAKDEIEAVRWYRKAAEQGNALAQNNLGVMCEAGRGTPQDDVEAVSWYRKAAEQGFTPSQRALERMCARGVREACS